MKLFLVFFLLIISTFSFDQAAQRIESILKIKREQIVKLEKVESSTVTYISSEFAEPTLNLQKQIAALQETSIIKVYYVYTQYKKSASFNQLELDRKRFNLLNAMIPGLVLDPIVQWQIIEQTGCKDYTNGDNYFHGFVIVHREIPTEKNRADEIEKLDAFLKGETDIIIEPLVDPIESQLNKTTTIVINQAENSVNKNNQVATYPDGERTLYTFLQNNLINSTEIGKNRVDTWVDIKFNVLANGDVDEILFLADYPEYIKEEITTAFERMPTWRPALSDDLPISSSVNLQIRISYSGDTKGMYTRDKLKPSFNDDPKNVVVVEIEEEGINLLTTPQAIDIKTTAVYKGLEIIAKKQNIALVMDVTGSMTTHIATMVKWIRANTINTPFTSFSFFNDGNNAATKNKKIGKTGGIYLTKSISEINKVLKEAMQMGNGGEAPENDIEAILYTLANDNLADEVLLIGDNYSEVRDLELLNEITKPVHVILCAAPKYVRNDYLMIAKVTGGDFILNGEIIPLAWLVKGDKITIQGIDYKYTGAEFEFVNKGNVVY